MAALLKMRANEKMVGCECRVRGLIEKSTVLHRRWFDANSEIPTSVQFKPAPAWATAK